MITSQISSEVSEPAISCLLANTNKVAPANRLMEKYIKFFQFSLQIFF